MNPKILKKILQDLAKGKIDPQSVYEKIKTLPYENLEFARIDHHRNLRSGAPEAIYCEGKSYDQIVKIILNIHQAGSDVLATRLDEEVFKKIRRKLPSKSKYHSLARSLTIFSGRKPKLEGNVLIASAGTSDIPVAEEAAVTAGWQAYFDTLAAGGTVEQASANAYEACGSACDNY